MKTLRNAIPTVIMITCFLFYGGNISAADPPTDLDISNAVESELLFNASTPSYLIDVNTIEGIVTLSGSVNDILAKDMAVKIAKNVKGVRGVVDKIQVDVPYRRDDVLEKSINNALLYDPATDSYEIVVKADNGHVTLTGTVESWQERQLSEFVAKGVSGVKSIENNITVKYTSNRSDYEIREDIIQSLKNDIRIDDALIDVSVKDGEVTLAGTVGSANEKSLAYFKASRSGANSVSFNKLEVKEWARDKNLRKNKYVTKTDSEIKDAVKDALLYDPRVLSFNPDVSVKDGVVTLTGVVDNLKAKKSAEQSAENVVGVSRVKNILKVRPAFIPDDKDLEAMIESAMLKNPVVEKWKIDVTAINGVVYLNGTVNSYFEKSNAEDIASKTNGVLAVVNNLSVFGGMDYYYYDYYGWNNFNPPYNINVKYGYNKSDNIIRENILDELWWSPYVNQDEVAVTVTNGKAILTGTVETKREKLFAEINALEGGAKEVENNLKVDYIP